jgi:hypothetical protein
MQKVATSTAIALSMIAGSLFMASEAGAYTLISRASPGFSQGGGTFFCASVAAGNVNTDGTQIIIWPCISGAQDQQWVETAHDATWFSMRSGSNQNQCMGVAAGSVNHGTQMVIWRYYGAGNQFWSKEPSPHPGCYYFRNMGSQLLLGVAGGKMSQGTPVIQWEKSGGLDQEWCTDNPNLPQKGPRRGAASSSK